VNVISYVCDFTTVIPWSSRVRVLFIASTSLPGR
jgi:hypothetical protein